MHYDLETNLATFFASDVVRYIPLNLFVTETGGAYTLTDPTAMNMLQFFPGLTVCIDDPDIIAKFKDAYPDKVAWANLFKYVVTEQGSFNLEIDYLRVEVKKGPKKDVSDLKVVNGKSVVIPDGCLESKEEIEEVVNTLFKKRIEEGKEEILFGKGCVKLALAHPTISITKDLADELKSLGDVAVWAKPHRDAYIEMLKKTRGLAKKVKKKKTKLVETYKAKELANATRLEELQKLEEEAQKPFRDDLKNRGFSAEEIDTKVKDTIFLTKEQTTEKGFLDNAALYVKNQGIRAEFLKTQCKEEKKPLPSFLEPEEEDALALRKSYSKLAQTIRIDYNSKIRKIKVDAKNKRAQLAKTGGKV
eukprot:GHVS01059929.1.p1 GENE.GHVS01059929.1~~GHVS01059929.1.p1  ORF type:complete len:361 (-),score=34.83 GHVS01059929.1:117-1199(-)